MSQKHHRDWNEKPKDGKHRKETKEERRIRLKNQAEAREFCLRILPVAAGVLLISTLLFGYYVSYIPPNDHGVIADEVPSVGTNLTMSANTHDQSGQEDFHVPEPCNGDCLQDQPRTAHRPRYDHSMIIEDADDGVAIFRPETHDDSGDWFNEVFEDLDEADELRPQSLSPSFVANPALVSADEPYPSPALASSGDDPLKHNGSPWRHSNSMQTNHEHTFLVSKVFNRNEQPPEGDAHESFVTIVSDDSMQYDHEHVFLDSAIVNHQGQPLQGDRRESFVTIVSDDRSANSAWTTDSNRARTNRSSNDNNHRHSIFKVHVAHSSTSGTTNRDFIHL